MLHNKEKIAVVGAGNMGAGIAQKYATHNYDVTLCDISDETLSRARKSIEETLAQGVQRKVFSEDSASAILNKIHFTKDLGDCHKSHLVIEAIFENLREKISLFRNLESICSKECIFASNTSSFLISAMQEEMQIPERFLGLHYFFHPAKNRLVEIISTKYTHSDFLTKAKELQDSIKKIAIVSKDSPGFIVNRFFVPWLNEAARIVFEQKSNFATIEKVCKDFFGVNMGPFQLLNVTGPSITFHACQSLAHNLGDFYSPCELIKNSHLEKKLFDYSGEIHKNHKEFIEERMLGVCAAVVTQTVFEEKVCNMADLDLGARVGLLWPKGPFELMNENMQKVAQYDFDTPKENYLGFTVPEILKEHIDENKNFSISHVSYTKEGNVGIIRLDRPDTLNALDEKLCEDLKTAFLSAKNDPEVNGIVICGHNRAFMAGADLGFFAKNIEANQIENILTFATKAQELFYEIDICKKPVIAAVKGLALGGGLELALACDLIVATKDCQLAFPETGIGIYPGLGGTQRTTKKIGAELARFLILSGSVISGEDGQKIGMIDHICHDSAVMAEAIQFARYGTFNTRSPYPEVESFNDIKSAFSDPWDIGALGNSTDLSPRVQKAIAKVLKKAPLATQKANELISKAREVSMSEGLKKEAEYLPFIFNSKDARNGITAAYTKKPINFEGA